MADPTDIDVSDIAKAKTRSTAPRGTTGVVSFGGYVQSGESSTALTGRAKWVTYTNALNVAIVATAVRYFGNLLAGTEWHAEPNPKGGKLAQRGVDVVTEGLLNAPLSTSWPFVVRKAAMFRFLGYSIHATGIARRPDGMVVYSDIQHRPQHTIEKWMRDDEQSQWSGVEQRSPQTGKLFPIPLDECFYCVDNLLTDHPEGVGLLRHAIELVRRLGLFEMLEGSGYFQDIAGLPVARVPLEDIIATCGSTDPTTQAAAISAATAAIQSAVANRVKTPEVQQWLKLDSSTYKSTDGNSISNVQKWGIEVLRSELKTADQLNRTIGRVGLEIARLLGIEFVMVGGGDSAGSYGMHEDKTSMFATMLETTIAEIGQFATQQLARRLVALNGLDPDTCTPTLVAAPISTDAIETVTRSLANLALAGLAPNDLAVEVLRKRMKLPPPPKVVGGDPSLMLPRPGRRKPKDGAEPTKPDDMTQVDDETKDKADDKEPTK